MRDVVDAERIRAFMRETTVTFRHFDPVAQALAKLERAQERDLDDVRALIRHGLADTASLRSTFEQIDPELYRLPAIDPAAFRRRVEDALV